jgi:hypothetical protein
VQSEGTGADYPETINRAPKPRYPLMSNLRLSAGVALSIVTLSVFGSLANATESYAWAGQRGFSSSFFLIGGQYTLYVNAKRPVTGYSTPSSRSCIFGGNLERVLPNPDSMSLGAGITISTIVPHKIGPTPLTLQSGLYKVYIAISTDCAWSFNL